MNVYFTIERVSGQVHCALARQWYIIVVSSVFECQLRAVRVLWSSKHRPYNQSVLRNATYNVYVLLNSKKTRAPIHMPLRAKQRKLAKARLIPTCCWGWRVAFAIYGICMTFNATRDTR